MLKSITNPDKPFTLGILGGGQLAKMIAQVAYRLGIEVAIIEGHSNSPAGDMTKLDFTQGWHNKEDLDKFIEVADIITLENEFIDTDILEYIAQKKSVFPSPTTMSLIQDKFIQKKTFRNHGLPVPHFEKIDSIEELLDFGKRNGYPFILKTRKYGYDGYGNATIKDEESAINSFNKFKSKDTNSTLLAESFVHFTKELAVMVARNSKGETELYPCVETIQENHICHTVIAPAEIDENIRENAQKIALKCVESINGIGVFGVELFLTLNNNLLVNEIAPRPHNSGHYTIESCYSSQFENCIKAVCGLPLGSAEMYVSAAVMVNLLGEKAGSGVPSDITKTLQVNKAFLHLYNKKNSRVGRKMGHITAVANSQEEAKNIALDAANSLIW